MNDLLKAALIIVCAFAVALLGSYALGRAGEPQSAWLWGMGDGI